MFRDVVTSVDELRALVGEPSELAVRKERTSLDAFGRAFIAQSPFALLATAGASGRCDVSPKGDGPGFVRVLDDTHLLVPDRPGNRRLDGMRNVLENPHVGLIFLIPGKEETFRVNGRAWIVRDAELLAETAVSGKRPLLGLGVEIEECFFHCAKAFRRARLWEPAGWPDAETLACLRQMQLDQASRATGASPEEIAHRLAESLQRLY